LSRVGSVSVLRYSTIESNDVVTRRNNDFVIIIIVAVVVVVALPYLGPLNYVADLPGRRPLRSAGTHCLPSK